MSQTRPFRVVVHGGGPVGCLVAMLLRAYTDDVTVVERRADARQYDADVVSHGRSINLVLTSRGLYALQQVGLREAVLRITVPVEGRLVHATSSCVNATRPSETPPSRPLMQRYGVYSHEVNYSVSRNELSKLLLSAAEARGVHVLFEHELLDVNLTSMTGTYRVHGRSASSNNGDGTTLQLHADLFVGADGVNSVTRGCMLAHHRRCATTEQAKACSDGRANAVSDGQHKLDAHTAALAVETLEPLGVSYKEIHFPARRADEVCRPKSRNNDNDSGGIDAVVCTEAADDYQQRKQQQHQQQQQQQQQCDNKPDTTYAMDCSGLHIWPHGVHFLMALANVDKTFTGTMYLPNRTAALPSTPHVDGTFDANDKKPKCSADGTERHLALPTFDELERDAVALQHHIATYYPDLPQYVPDWVMQLQQHRASALYTLHCPTWHYAHKVVLLGDAAHAVTPFFGQGLNLGFESTMLFDRFVRRSGAFAQRGSGIGGCTTTTTNTNTTGEGGSGSSASHTVDVCNDNMAERAMMDASVRAERLAAALAAYEDYHHPNSDAVARMSKANFVDMAQRTAQDEWRQLRALEKWVEARHPHTFRSHYYLVTQTLTPYCVAELAAPVLEACLRALMQLYTERVRDIGQSSVHGDAKSGGGGGGGVGDDAAQRFDDVLTHEDVCDAIAQHVTPFARLYGLRFGEPAYDGYYPCCSPAAATA